MIISVVNLSHTLADLEVQRVVRAVNRQLAQDFEPHWQFGAQLRLDSIGERPHAASAHPDLHSLPGRRGDAAIYLMDKASVAGAEGYHDRNAGDVPFGFVFLDICEAVGDPWSVALSHEAIELVGDPMNNLLVQGPSPHDRRHLVFHMFELCDAVQSETYEIEGVAVSNFVLPGWFTRGEVSGVRNDFLGRPDRGDVLQSFSIAPGGYLCFYDFGVAKGDKWVAYMPPADAESKRRHQIKSALTASRLAQRKRSAAGVGG